MTSTAAEAGERGHRDVKPGEGRTARQAERQFESRANAACLAAATSVPTSVAQRRPQSAYEGALQLKVEALTHLRAPAGLRRGVQRLIVALQRVESASVSGRSVSVSGRSVSVSGRSVSRGMRAGGSSFAQRQAERYAQRAGIPTCGPASRP